MPRILWEEKSGLSVPSERRASIGGLLRVNAAAIVTKYDPSFELDPDEHTVFDILKRHLDARGDNDVIVTVRGMYQPERVKHSKEIGDELRAAADHMFVEAGLSWSLSLCWDEYYYNDGKG